MKSIKELMNSVEYNNGKLPKEELEEIISRKEEAVPFLLDYLQGFKENYENFIDKRDFNGHIYASFLLAQFKEKKLFEIFMDLIKLPGETPFDLFGDIITEDTVSILVSVFDGQISDIKELIENNKYNEYVRGQGAHVLATLVLNEVLEREETVNYFIYLLNGGLKDRQSDVLTSIVCCLVDLYPKEGYESIKICFENGEIDTFTIGFDEVEEILELEKGIVISRSRKEAQDKIINDTIKSIGWWACFEDTNKKSNKFNLLSYEDAMKSFNDLKNQQSAKIGRNDPCSCGSGKKYKKCCGK